MPKKQSGGSPASTSVNAINQGYLKALSEVPVGTQSCQSGGSPASVRVNSLLSQEGCGSSPSPSSPVMSGDATKLPLYKTSGGGKKSKRSNQKAGGSDWISSQYSRGPVNYPNNPEQFKKFAGPYDEFITNQELYYEGLKEGSASNAAPFPFPQKGGSKSKSRKSKKSKSRKLKSKSKSKSKVGGYRVKSKSKSRKVRKSGKKTRKSK